MKDRATSLDYVRTVGRLGRAVIARGGSMSFEWPRHCEKWKDETVKLMLEDLKLDPVDVDGCAIGVQSKTGEPILKPWQTAVNYPLVRKAQDGLRCQGTHTRPVLRERDGTVRILLGAPMPCDPRRIGRAQVRPRWRLRRQMMCSDS